MSMKGSMQATLAPVSPPNSVDFNQMKVAQQEKAVDMGEANPGIDFRTMLQNSNSETSRERVAKKSGDLSGAKTDEDFYRMLNERNNPSRTPKNQMGKDDFMKLFIAQMQNQDPLNPSDASQMAAQMAQFNSLEQMMNVNTTLTQMMKAQEQGRTVQMVNYVGKEVDVGTGMLKYDKNKLTKANFEIDQALPGAILEVRDGSGQVISQQELGSIMPGEHKVKWNGKLKDGKDALPGMYNFQIVGKTTEGQEMAIPIKSKVKVTGIDLKDEGGSFYTELGKIQVKDIASVGVQGFEDAKARTVEAMGAGTPSNQQQQQGPVLKAAEQSIEEGQEQAQNVLTAPPAGLPPELMEMAQKMINDPNTSSENQLNSSDEASAGANGNEVEASNAPIPNPAGIKVEVATAGG